MTSRCLSCMSPNMSYGLPVVTEQARSIELPMTCARCRHQWLDIYTFNSSQLSNHD